MNGRRTVHFIGIGGVGMAALAVLLKNRGCAVSGCDLSRSARTDWLESLGIPVVLGHDPAHVEGTQSDDDRLSGRNYPAKPDRQGSAAAGAGRYAGAGLSRLLFRNAFA